MNGKAGAQAGVTFDKPVHLVPVAGQNQNEVVLIVFHAFHQDVDRFFAEILFSAAGQGIGFVNKQNAAQGLFQLLARFLRRMSDILADQIGPFHLDQVPLRQHAHFFKKAADNPGHRRLSRAGVSFENHVQHLGFHRQLFFLAPFLNLHQGVDFANQLFNFPQPDQRV